MDIMQDVIARLNDLGFNAISEEPSVVFAIERARERILNDINRKTVPEGLKYTFIDMACGYYLHDQRAAGTLDTSALEGGKVSSITEGDVTVSFATGSSSSPDERFEALVQGFLNPPLLARYRRLTW